MLRLENVKVRYGDFQAVSSVSLEIGEGERTALIGTNGSGKSTLLKAVSGLMAPSGGRIFFKERDVTGFPAEKLVQLGLSLVPAGGRCFSRMSVEDNLIVGSYPRSSRKKVKDSLDFVYSLFPALGEMRKMQAGNLSGGQRQMTAIGRALMSRPSCILFDEISLGLSPITVRDVYACLRRLNQEEKMTELFVEQDFDRVITEAETCFVMRKGEIVLSGRTEDLDREAVREAYFGTEAEERTEPWNSFSS